MQQVQVALPIGTIIRTGNRDCYFVEDLLGKGGFGAIYLVRDQRVKQNLFALKEVINPDKHERAHFTFEFEVLTRLDHPALPRVYRIFEDFERNHVYVLMDYIEGPNLELLRQQQSEKRFSLSEVRRMMNPIMEAVTFLHSQSPPIVHRDIKPTNIIVSATNGEAILVDFGIAKEYVPEDTTTAVRHCSPGYGAPEQYSTGTTPLTDIYGLGATIYTLLTGNPPTDSLLRMVRLSNKEQDPLLPVNQLVQSVPAEIAQAIHRSLDLSSHGRFSSVEEFRHALNARPAEQPSRKPLMVVPITPQPNVLPRGAVNSTATISFPRRLHILPSLKRGTLLLILLVLLIGLVGGVGVSRWYRAGNDHRSHASPLPISLSKTRREPTAIPTSFPYPPIAEQYGGTISDLVAQVNTSMSLFSVHQSGGNIQGYFTGLGMSGPFKGTVTTAEHVQFQVTIYAGNGTLSFEGTIQLGGNIAGTYQALDQNKHFTGEAGLWSAAPASADKSRFGGAA